MSEIHPFPSARHRTIVHAVAARVAAQSTRSKAEEELRSHLQIQWDQGEHRGIDPVENERDVLSFAAAVEALLSAPHVEILDRAVASVTGVSRRRRQSPAPLSTRRHEPVLQVEIGLPRTKVIPFPRFRGARYIDDLVSLMLSVDRLKGEALFRREKQVIAENMVGAGADPEAVERAIRYIEGTVRRRIWELVLLPEISHDL